MDQTQQVDDDLQKAIDDITNTTNVDPVFSDPVAAPSTIPEGDTGELSEPVGPFPEEPKVQMVSPAPEPIAPLQSADIPELNSLSPIKPTTKTPDVNKTELDEVKPDGSEPASPKLTPTGTLNTTEVKKAALRDLIPILGNLKINPVQKFNVYRDIFDELKDYTAIEQAYEAAREIPDETTRAEALLYLVESIDKM